VKQGGALGDPGSIGRLHDTVAIESGNILYPVPADCQPENGRSEKRIFINFSSPPSDKRADRYPVRTRRLSFRFGFPVEQIRRKNPALFQPGAAVGPPRNSGYTFRREKLNSFACVTYSLKIPVSRQLLHDREFFRLVRKRFMVPSLKPLRSAIAAGSNGVLHPGHWWDIVDTQEIKFEFVPG
jgi:hypothetical protein